MNFFDVIFEAVLMCIAYCIGAKELKKNKQQGLIFLGNAFLLVMCIVVAFLIAQLFGATMLGVIDYVPHYTPFEVAGFLATSVIVVKAIEVFGKKK